METSEDQSLFQCGSCKRQYRRLDHLARHVRSHTQSRPHKCHICGKRFTRTDLLKRHVGSHKTAQTNQEPTSSAHQVGRVSKACRACSAQHLRCSEEKPCQRCKDKNLECTWNSQTDAVGLYSPPATDHPPNAANTEDAEDQQFGNGEPSPCDTAQVPDPSINSDTIAVALNNDDDELSGLSHQMSFDHINPQLVPGDLNLSSFWMPHPDDFDTGTMEVEINDEDLQFLDRYNLSIPFERVVTPQPLSRDEQRTACTTVGETVSLGIQRSPWLFQPGAQDHVGAEEHNLSLPQVPGHPSPEYHVPQDENATKVPLMTNARDKILAMVARCCQSDNVSKIFLAFPSVQLLNALVQYYFTSPIAWPHLFLHAPTFDPNEKQPELVAAVAAAGAILTADPVLIKLGYAIQEAVRISVPKHWEKDNLQTRELELAQAFLIILEIGLWSGHGRKVEIAECFLQPLLTTLRRGGKFKNTAYTQKSNQPDLHGKELEKNWNDFVEQESFKRLCFRVLLHDTNCSMALLVNPLISYVEMLLPVPGSLQAWTARTAEDWKSIHNSEVENPPLTVADLLESPEVLADNYTSSDHSVATFAIQSFAWTLCWEYVQLKALQRQMPRRWSSVVTDMRREELIKLIQTMRISLSLSGDHEVMMRLETTSLHLFMSFEQIQVLAGFEGPAQSRAIFPYVKEWRNTEAARHALYHASQIFRFAKTARKGSMRGPTAFMLYYASLAFWVWGSLEEQPDLALPRPAAKITSVGSAVSSTSSKEVILDGHDDLSVQRFIQFGHGTPYIQVRKSCQSFSVNASTTASVELSSTVEVMDSVRQLLEDDFHSTARPALISKLMRLITELGNSYKRLRGLHLNG